MTVVVAVDTVHLLEDSLLLHIVLADWGYALIMRLEHSRIAAHAYQVAGQVVVVQEVVTFHFWDEALFGSGEILAHVNDWVEILVSSRNRMSKLGRWLKHVDGADFMRSRRMNLR